MDNNERTDIWGKNRDFFVGSHGVTKHEFRFDGTAVHSGRLYAASIKSNGGIESSGSLKAASIEVGGKPVINKYGKLDSNLFTVSNIYKVQKNNSSFYEWKDLPHHPNRSICFLTGMQIEDDYDTNGWLNRACNIEKRSNNYRLVADIKNSLHNSRNDGPDVYCKAICLSW